MATGYYADYLRTARARHGARFTDAGLLPAFIPAFESGDRIEVTRTYANGETWTRRGTVGVTTGWAPVFLLLSRVTACSSGDLLGTDDQIVGVIRRGRR